MKKGQREAIKAVQEYLKDRKDPAMLFNVSCVADQAAMTKRKTELFPSLYDYVDLLPAGWTTSWLTSSGSTDHMLYAVPRDWRPGSSPSQTALMPGMLIY